MLPSERRIKDKDLISLILKTGRVIRSPLFNIYLKKIAGPSQLAVVVSKKVSKKAVDRNQLKRRMVNIFKEFEQKVGPTTKMVLVLKKEIMSVSKGGMREEFEKALSDELSE